MDMDNPIPLIDFVKLGQRLSRLRTAHHWTLDDLAERSGLSVSYLSRVESGVRQPSLGTLAALAQVYGITMAELFSTEDDPCIIVRGADAPMRRGNDLAYSLLSRRGAGRGGYGTLQAVRIAVPPQGVATYRHDGEEWLHVLSGQLQLSVGDEEHLLTVGDSAHFDARVAHRFSSAAVGTLTEILIVACVARHPLLSSYI